MLSLPNIAKLRKNAVPSKSGNSIAPKRPMKPRCCPEIGLRISRDAWPKIAKVQRLPSRSSNRRPGPVRIEFVVRSGADVGQALHEIDDTGLVRHKRLAK